MKKISVFFKSYIGVQLIVAIVIVGLAFITYELVNNLGDNVEFVFAEEKTASHDGEKEIKPASSENKNLDFAVKPKEALKWSKQQFPSIPRSFRNNEDIDKIRDINKKLRRKYMNRSELYDNQEQLKAMDNLFVTSASEDILLYANFNGEDFGINSDYIYYNPETILNLVLKDSEYGIDHGYLLGTLTPKSLDEKQNIFIRLEINIPKGTKMTRVGSLEESQFILERGQALHYTKKEIFKDGDTEGIKISAELISETDLNKQTEAYNKAMAEMLAKKFNIPNSFIKILPLGLNAGFVFSEGQKVAEQAIEILRNKNFLNDHQTNIWNVFFTTGFKVHTETFDIITKDMTLEERKKKFEASFSDSSLGTTRWLTDDRIDTNLNFNNLSNKMMLRENRIIEEMSSTFIHEYLHFEMLNNDFFKKHPMFQEETMEQMTEKLMDSELDTLVDILKDPYAKDDWEEFLCEAFRAKLHPYKPIAKASEEKMLKTNRFLTNIFDVLPPTVPQNLKELETAGNSVKFTFDHSKDDTSVERYNIYKDGELVKHYNTKADNNGLHSPTPGDDQEKIEVNIDGLDQVTEYEFRVTAMDEAKNESEKSEPLKIKTKDTEPPELSGNLGGKALGSRLVNLRWPRPTDNVGVSKVKIRRLDSSSIFNSFKFLRTEKSFEVPGDINYFSDVMIQKGQTYTYSMTAIDEAGNESERSNDVVITTSDEDDRKRNEDKAENTTSSNSTLNWSGSFGGISPSGFQIFGWASGLTGWAFTGMTSVGSSATTALVSLTPGLTHIFLILPVDEKGNPMDEDLEISLEALPNKVEGLKITDVKRTYISLEWENKNSEENLTEELHHDIYRNGSLVATVSGATTSFIDRGLAPGTLYDYYVVARIGKANQSEGSQTVTAKTLAPYNDTIIRLESQLFEKEVLTHSNQTGERIFLKQFINAPTQFIQVMYDESKKSYQLVNTLTQDVWSINPNNQNEIITGKNEKRDDQFWHLQETINHTVQVENYKNPNQVLEVDDQRNINIKEKNDALDSQQFNLLIDEESPTQPTNLSCSNITDSSVQLSWTASEDNVGVSQYKIFSQFGLVGSVDSNNTTFTATNLLSYTEYSFTVVAVDGSENNSESSEALKVTTRPKAPINLKAAELTQNSLTLTWENEEKDEVVKSYEVYQDEKLIGVVGNDTLTYQVENLKTAMTYNYTIKAKAELNSSLASKKLSLKTKSLPLKKILKEFSLPENQVVITLDRDSYEGQNRIVLVNQGKYIGETYNNKSFYGNVIKKSKTTVSIRYITALDTNDLALELRTGKPGDQKDEVLERISILPLAPPKDLKVDEVNENDAVLSWESGDNSSSETGYEIYKNGELVQTIDNTVKSYKIENLESATNYTFTVKAKVDNQISLPSNEATIKTKPKSPKKLKADDITESSVSLSWESGERAEVITGYEIYQDEKLIGLVDKNTLTYKVEKLISATKYRFTVKTKTSADSSLPSNEATIITKPKSPKNLKADDITESSVSLSWESGERAEVITGYEIYQDEKLIEVVDKDILTYQVKNLKPSSVYGFVVKTRADFDNISDPSEELKVETNPENSTVHINLSDLSPGDQGNGFFFSENTLSLLKNVTEKEYVVTSKGLTDRGIIIEQGADLTVVFDNLSILNKHPIIVEEGAKVNFILKKSSKNKLVSTTGTGLVGNKDSKIVITGEENTQNVGKLLVEGAPENQAIGGISSSIYIHEKADVVALTNNSPAILSKASENLGNSYLINFELTGEENYPDPNRIIHVFHEIWNDPVGFPEREYLQDIEAKQLKNKRVNITFSTGNDQRYIRMSVSEGRTGDIYDYENSTYNFYPTKKFSPIKSELAH